MTAVRQTSVCSGLRPVQKGRGGGFRSDVRCRPKSASLLCEPDCQRYLQKSRPEPLPHGHGSASAYWSTCGFRAARVSKRFDEFRKRDCQSVPRLSAGDELPTAFAVETKHTYSVLNTDFHNCETDDQIAEPSTGRGVETKQSYVVLNIDFHNCDGDREAASRSFSFAEFLTASSGAGLDADLGGLTTRLQIANLPHKAGL